MSASLSSTIFLKILLYLIYAASQFIAPPSFAISSSVLTGIENIVLVYDQPLQSTDLGRVLSLLNDGSYTSKIDTKLFAPGSSVWIYVPQNVILADTARKILVTGYQDYIDVYAVVAHKWQKIQTGGKYVPLHTMSALVGREFVTLYENTNDISKKGYLICCRKYNNFNFSPLLANLKSRSELLEWQLEFRRTADKYPKLIFPLVGVLITTVLHLLILFFLSKNWSYTYHAIGLLFTLSFFTLCYYQYPVNINDSPNDDPKVLINFDCFVLYLALACNFMSVRGFYDTGKEVQLNNLLTARLAFVSVFVALVSLVFSLATNLYYLVNYASMILEPIISGIYAVHLVKIRNEIKHAFRIYIFGLCFLTVFLEVAFILSTFASNNKWGIGSEVLLIFPMIMGISIFNGFIITAVVTRDYQGRLESASLRTRATEAEMTAIQKGMSPHFVFNCLNLIDSFLYNNDSKAARSILFNFSDMLRLVIDKSPNKLIQLNDELTILQLYMNLEKSRLDDSFTYSITVAQNIDANLVYVPPLIIQPIVENAIKHGILNRKNKGGKVNVIINTESFNMLEITIDDNGVGRKFARQLQSSAYHHVGHVGISHTKKRLEIVSEIFKTESSLEILDKNNGYEGTIVKIRLPILYQDVLTNT